MMAHNLQPTSADEDVLAVMEEKAADKLSKMDPTIK